MINVYGMPSKANAPDAYADFLRHEGAPLALRRENSGEQSSRKFIDLNRFMVADEYTEPHHPHQNPAELWAVRWLKDHTQVLLDRTGAPPRMWLSASQ